MRQPVRQSLRRGIDRRVERELYARGYAKPGDDRAFREELRAMFDSGPLGAVNPRKSQFKFFPGMISATPSGYQTWTIPRNATWVYIVCAGGGASGAGGQTSGAGVLGGGGGGGGSGSMSRLLIPAFFLPKILYLAPGAGGIGVAAATIGNTGARSSVTDKPVPNILADIVLISGTNAAAAPIAPTGASSGGGAAETIDVATNHPYSGLGLWTAIIGQAGTAGGASAGAGVGYTWGSLGIFCSSGTGGGTTNTTVGAGAGGAITGAGLVASVPGGAAASRGNNGVNHGFLSGGSLGPSATAGQQFASTGGTGGGAGASTTGGAGGNGGFSSGGGGGGGGGGTSGGTGGAGGAGGPGFIVISWW